MVVYKITASLGGGGVLDYEVCMSIDNNSNNPSVGSSANSYTANGKRYDFQDGLIHASLGSRRTTEALHLRA